MLMAEGLGQHVSKGYIYFAMAFRSSLRSSVPRKKQALSPSRTRGAAPQGLGGRAVAHAVAAAGGPGRRGIGVLVRQSVAAMEP
jgi:hypothetical protein